MWHPFKNKAVRVDSTQVVSVVKDMKDRGVSVGSGADYRPSYFWLPGDYENLIKQATKGAVIVIAVYMGSDTIRKCAINMSIDVVPLIYGTVVDVSPTP